VIDLLNTTTIKEKGDRIGAALSRGDEKHGVNSSGGGGTKLRKRRIVGLKGRHEIIPEIPSTTYKAST